MSKIICLVLFIIYRVSYCNKFNLYFPATYDKTVSHAATHVEDHVEIAINVFPVAIIDVQESEMLVEIELFVNLNWTDRRVSLNMSFLENGYDNPLKPSQLDRQRLWTPPVYFVNCHNCKPTQVFVGSQRRKQYDLRVHPDNMMFEMFFRDFYVFRCSFDTTNFPMDEHVCKIILELRPRDERDKHHLRLMHHPTLRDKLLPAAQEQIPPQFYYMYYESENKCLYPGWKVPEHCLQYVIRFRRALTPYLINTYIPSMLSVLIAWASLWLPLEEGAARLVFGAVAVLLLSTQIATTTKSLPTGIKAIDVWLVTCFLSAFLLFIQFFIAECLRRQKKMLVFEDVKGIRKPERRLTPAPNLFKEQQKTVTFVASDAVHDTFFPQIAVPVRHNRFDQICRTVFPLVFALFNIIYWSYYSIDPTAKER